MRIDILDIAEAIISSLYSVIRGVYLIGSSKRVEYERSVGAQSGSSRLIIRIVAVGLGRIVAESGAEVVIQSYKLVEGMLADGIVAYSDSCIDL